MKIRMLVEKTGPRYDGRSWPPRGEEFIVPDEEGAALCAQGDAAPVVEEREAETPESKLEVTEEQRQDPPPPAPAAAAPKAKAPAGRQQAR